MSLTEQEHPSMPRCDIEELEKEMESLRHYQTVQNEDIGKLRGLLQDCKLFFEEENPKDFTVMSERMDELLIRINDVVGESEE